MNPPLGYYGFNVNFGMDLSKLNMYQRLRDYEIPSSILDEIFADDSDLNILETSWKELENAGLSGDDIANEIAKIIFDQLDLTPAQLQEEK